MSRGNLFTTPLTPLFTPLKDSHYSPLSTPRNSTTLPLGSATLSPPCIRRLFAEHSPSTHGIHNIPREVSPISEKLFDYPLNHHLLTKNLTLSPIDAKLEPVVSIKEQKVEIRDSHDEQRSEGKGCNCKRSQCLKLYCECFAKGVVCKNCNCIGCHNKEQNEFDIETAKEIISSRNPIAFIKRMNKEKMVTCNCERSGCLKKYCECYKEGKKCSGRCNCINCKNKLKPILCRIGKNIKKHSKIKTHQNIK